MFNFFGDNENTWITEDIFKDIRIAIYKELSEILVACINCWNNLPILNWREYHFSRAGMFSYNQSDNGIIREQLKRKKKDKDD